MIKDIFNSFKHILYHRVDDKPLRRLFQAVSIEEYVESLGISEIEQLYYFIMSSV